MPVSTPTGVAINDAKPTTIIVPWIAGPIPPFPEPMDPCETIRNSKLSADNTIFHHFYQDTTKWDNRQQQHIL